MKNIRRTLLTAALSMAAAGFANASTIIQTFSLPGGSTTTSWSDSATINKFDTSLGQLEFIRIIAFLSDTASAGATDNTGTGTSTYVISAITTLNLSDPTNGLLVAPTTSVASTFNSQTQGDVMSVSGARTASVSAKWLVDPAILSGNCAGTEQPGCLSLGTSPADPLNYGAYQAFGGGTLSLTANATTAGSFSGPSFSGAFASGTASTNVTVIYDYILATSPSTPEPTTMVLFGAGLVGLGLIRRRLKA